MVILSSKAWGVKKITFVDNGKVSYSNPVRQSLYTFEDCALKDNFKAKIAAGRLQKIYPAVDAQGLVLNIPMPGHTTHSGGSKSSEDEYNEFFRLVNDHSIIFLLTDSRESRWLPTVIGVATGKLVINVALGFDSFLVMRHGVIENGKPHLGCYFCNDVVAPIDVCSGLLIS